MAPADSTPAVTIRDAIPPDVPTLIDLLRLGALGDRGEDAADPSPYLAALDAIEAAPGQALLVADVDGRVAPVGMGQLLVFRHFQAKGGLCAELESVHVHPDWRNRGIGGLLVEGAVDRARDTGCYRIQLTSNVARTDAHRFYGHHHFSPTHQGFKRLLDGPR